MAKEKKMLIGLACNCHGGGEHKFLLLSLLSLFSLLAVLPFLPISPKISLLFFLSNYTVEISPPPPPLPTKEVLPAGIIKSRFRPYGSTAYAFILMSAYRTGPDTFSLIGLSSKLLDRFSNPSYLCQWVPHNATSPITSAVGHKILPDWGYGRIYTTVVITCNLDAGASSGSGAGGKLLLVTAFRGGNTELNQTHTIEALTEKPQIETLAVDSNLTNPRYDYLYCGSSMYGDLSPQRIREWIVYHVWLFGPQSHIVFYDAGGVHAAVMEVLRPWMELGYVTLYDIREQERFDAYYHNQFMIVNDCLHRHRFDARWIFFFDVDEYLYLPKRRTIKFVTDSLAEFSQFTFEQMPMSNQLCLEEDRASANKRWGFEKLVYREAKRVGRRDRKYAVQPQNVFATGVHISQNLVGKTNHKTWDLIKYFHYHGTVSVRNETCRRFTNATYATVDEKPYVMDTTMRGIAPMLRKFELKMIGPKLQGTQQ